MEEEEENPALDEFVKSFATLSKNAMAVAKQMSNAFNGIEKSLKEVKDEALDLRAIRKHFVEMLNSNNINDSIRLTKEHFKLADDFKLDLKLTITFNPKDDSIDQ
jgi:hypothetical protein